MRVTYSLFLITLELITLIKYYPHSRYPYSGIMMEFAWSKVPKNYTGGSVPIGGVLHARQVTGDD
jgi:hypothetical protein